MRRVLRRRRKCSADRCQVANLIERAENRFSLADIGIDSRDLSSRVQRLPSEPSRPSPEAQSPAGSAGGSGALQGIGQLVVGRRETEIAFPQGRLVLGGFCLSSGLRCPLPVLARTDCHQLQPRVGRNGQLAEVSPTRSRCKFASRPPRWVGRKRRLAALDGRDDHSDLRAPVARGIKKSAPGDIGPRDQTTAAARSSASMARPPAP